jgi:hypothetical protein
MRPYLRKKYLVQNRSGGVAEVVEQLYEKHMALSSNSTIITNNRKKKFSEVLRYKRSPETPCKVLVGTDWVGTRASGRNVHVSVGAIHES